MKDALKQNLKASFQFCIQLSFHFISIYFNYMGTLEVLEPRGLRNNNPLNIRHGQSRWQGTHPEKKDKEFVCYMTKAYGYRAAWKILQTYYETFTKTGKPFNLYNIIHRWAPPEDNNETARYLHTVLKYTHLAGMQRLPEPRSDEGFMALQPVLIAMTCVENGIKPEEVPVSAILQGYQLAFTKVLLNIKH